ncbi:hypothetical protein C2G38_2155280 [Gigaspora rosea]|uniref:Uncharacterized protein n=1 Tax=Gigaspora rosea TaxID=44941 RepID=A0A397W478_9GLOM|nr:hypothetical protein C2G38_2155280 [Gigaspora rosea]
MGDIIAPYLQRKMYNNLTEGIYKRNTLIKRTQSLRAKAQHLQDQKSKYISEIRSLASKKISDEEFREKIKSVVISNKRSYSSNTICLQRTFYKLVEHHCTPLTNLYFHRQQLQNIIKCNADVVSDIVVTHIQKCGLDITKCRLWVTDNTSYMSGDREGTMAFFNEK